MTKGFHQYLTPPLPVIPESQCGTSVWHQVEFTILWEMAVGEQVLIPS